MAKKLSRAEKIRRYLTANPDMALKDVAARFDTTYQVVYMVRKNMPKKVILTATEAMLANKTGVTTAEYAKQKVKILREPKMTRIAMFTSNTPITMEEPVSDPVDHPAHYKVGGIETIDFIEAKEFNYNMGNAVKYISRAEHKGDKKQDLEKAIWYLNRELAKA